jgi:hypothetical protein
MRRLWMVLVVAVGLLLVSAGAAVAQSGEHAEQVGKGSSDALDGLSGLYSDLTSDPTWGKFVGWALIAAVGLWLLRLLGLRRG